MKIITLTAIVFLLLNANSSFGQGRPDTIEIREGRGLVYFHKGERLTPKQILEIKESNSEAHKEMKRAMSNYNAASVFAGVGGALIGWPLGTAAGGGDPNWI